MNELIHNKTRKAPLLFLGGNDCHPRQPDYNRGWLTRENHANHNNSQQNSKTNHVIGNNGGALNETNNYHERINSQQNLKTKHENHNKTQQFKLGHIAFLNPTSYIY